MLDISANWVIAIYLSPKLSAELTLKQWQCLILILRNQQLVACYSTRFKENGVFDQIPLKMKRHFLNADVIVNNHKKQVEFEATELKRVLTGQHQYLIFLKGAGYTNQYK
jgi:hypothetical protein